MTLSDEEANRRYMPEVKLRVPDDNKELLWSFYFDNKPIQYSGKINPSEDDWLDYTKSDFPPKSTFINYKWRLKPEIQVKRCRLALVELGGIKDVMIVGDYNSAKVLETQMCDERFIRWLTEWIIWMDN